MAGSNTHTSLQVVQAFGEVQQVPWERSVWAAMVSTGKQGAPCAMYLGIVSPMETYSNGRITPTYCKPMALLLHCLSFRHYAHGSQGLAQRPSPTLQQDSRR